MRFHGFHTFPFIDFRGFHEISWISYIFMDFLCISKDFIRFHVISKESFIGWLAWLAGLAGLVSLFAGGLTGCWVDDEGWLAAGLMVRRKDSRTSHTLDALERSADF